MRAHLMSSSYRVLQAPPALLAHPRPWVSVKTPKDFIRASASSGLAFSGGSYAVVGDRGKKSWSGWSKETSRAALYERREEERSNVGHVDFWLIGGGRYTVRCK